MEGCAARSWNACSSSSENASGAFGQFSPTIGRFQRWPALRRSQCGCGRTRSRSGDLLQDLRGASGPSSVGFGNRGEQLGLFFGGEFNCLIPFRSKNRHRHPFRTTIVAECQAQETDQWSAAWSTPCFHDCLRITRPLHGPLSIHSNLTATPFTVVQVNE